MLTRASAVEFVKTGQEMRTDVPVRQLKLIVVLDLHQVQAVRVRRDPAQATLTAFQHLLDPLHRPLTGTNGHQHAGNIAHHVMQKRTGADVQHNHVPVTGDTQVMHFFDR